ncbi:MAG: hypothetical protein US68_C0006G0065 [Candidatus Shapirobacteria bacterium GW2011_GWE1_38_10]|uniref:Uncharacterized protein n=1 Tax=Candidatus Shapirobacteria bacterium GW2011_GWE1_38_10 TaxID=1618488 RepID=A0A0G0IHA4_9BACT|nr:MAG: hypothetical protein US46_C0002G0114 [Candidatus Shapirobacteria bacterium GW2011_GWF2_37_20]KKQ50385.1 MAG: hypothetical protein US68_C0006G0065 [Candidatus Shapirobacteria bacterium GW2011_GWE1_38_10]KKQ65209.1 MAG: hypothetical protein US85_C0001G0136 [Candidatus Shapirobacteria bacterium GW2011_GWF1_38_23]HBP51214.1 hypothetical protein [Candidatus Shapirobacteria bacterium]
MDNKITPTGYLLIVTFFVLLGYAAWISAKSIDWDVLKKMENSPLSLPTPVVVQNSTPSATPTVDLKK